ncbi:TetR/AcrR family transcriptional regulator [Actibacterium sp. D379-3]
MTHVADQIRKGRKYEQVLDGARAVFMRDGFEGAGVDDIAREAGVSKATLYSYFPDKRLLFMEVAKCECHRQIIGAPEILDDGAPVDRVLEAAARHMVRFLLSGFGQSVYRLCVGESDRFPELGEIFYGSGPRNVRKQLTDYLSRAAARNELAIEDVELAADQLAELCKVDLFPKMMFGIKKKFSDAEVDRVIQGAVGMFMARYGVRG